MRPTTFPSLVFFMLIQRASQVQDLADLPLPTELLDSLTPMATTTTDVILTTTTDIMAAPYSALEAAMLAVLANCQNDLGDCRYDSILELAFTFITILRHTLLTFFHASWLALVSPGFWEGALMVCFVVLANSDCGRELSVRVEKLIV